MGRPSVFTVLRALFVQGVSADTNFLSQKQLREALRAFQGSLLMGIVWRCVVQVVRALQRVVSLLPRAWQVAARRRIPVLYVMHKHDGAALGSRVPGHLPLTFLSGEACTSASLLHGSGLTVLNAGSYTCARTPRHGEDRHRSDERAESGWEPHLTRAPARRGAQMRAVPRVRAGI